MSQQKHERFNELIRSRRGLRIETKPPEQSTLSRVINEYIRGEVGRAKTTLPLDHPALTGRDRR